MTLNLWTFLFEVLNFLVLAFVLHRLLYRPLREAIEQRQQAIARGRAEAETTTQEATALQQRLHAQLAEREQERQRLLQGAHDQAEVERKKLLVEAERVVRERQEELRELETFARFGAELEPATRQRLERGRRLREALKQPRLNPWRLGHEAATLFAIREGILDTVAVEQVGPFLDALRRYLDEVDRTLLELLEREGELTEEVRQRLRQALEAICRSLPTAEAV